MNNFKFRWINQHPLVLPYCGKSPFGNTHISVRYIKFGIWGTNLIPSVHSSLFTHIPQVCHNSLNLLRCSHRTCIMFVWQWALMLVSQGRGIVLEWQYWLMQCKWGCPCKRKALQHLHCKSKLLVSSRVGLGLCIRTVDGLALKEMGI